MYYFRPVNSVDKTHPPLVLKVRLLLCQLSMKCLSPTTFFSKNTHRAVNHSDETTRTVR